MDKVILKCPIGNIKLSQTKLGVHEINLDQDYNLNQDIINCNNKTSEIEVIGEYQFCKTKETIQWIKTYFENPQQVNNLKLPELDNHIFEKENFTSKVLQTLYSKVGPGNSVSYAELAKMCGSAKACRAVGQAMRANPVPLVVPCHRVISSSGESGPYMRGKGNNIKKWLLNYEKSL